MRRRFKTKKNQEEEEYIIINNLKWYLKPLSAPANNVDIVEYNGYSYFSWEAAQREAAKVGKRCPTYPEFSALDRLGSSWDEELKGRWFGRDHSLKSASKESILLKALGNWGEPPYTAIRDYQFAGVYWSSTFYGNGNWYRNLNFAPTFTIHDNRSPMPQAFNVILVKNL